MGWPKGKKRGPKQPIPDADNPPKKKRIINKKVIWNLKNVFLHLHTHSIFINSQSKKADSASVPQSNLLLENAERMALPSKQLLENAERVIAAVASGKVDD